MAKRRTPNKQQVSQYLNNVTFIDYYQRLKELALNVYEWKNLPPTVDERFLELTLFEKGYAVWFRDEIAGDIALTCTIGGRLDIYRIPIFRKAYSVNGYQKNLTTQDSVLIFNNYLHTPTELTIRLYAQRLYNIQRAIDTNINAQKTPVMILCDEQQRLTMQNVFMQYDGNEPVIFGDNKLFQGNTIDVLKTDAPFVADKLFIMKNRLWNECLTFLGIENSNQDKKERMVTDEVGSNYGNVEASRNVMLNSRKQACEKINAMFGLDIDVTFRSTLPTNVNRATQYSSIEEFDAPTEGGDDDE